MKSLQKILFLFVAGLLAASSAVGQQVHILHDNVGDAKIMSEEGGSVIIVVWDIENLDLVTDYSLERSVNGNSSGFQNLNKSNCNQTGNQFRCVDRDLYKGSTDQTAATERVSYRLQVTHPDGTLHLYFTAEESYTTNAVRRTWGSIKSMFQ